MEQAPPLQPSALARVLLSWPLRRCRTQCGVSKLTHAIMPRHGRWEQRPGHAARHPRPPTPVAHRASGGPPSADRYLPLSSPMASGE